MSHTTNAVWFTAPRTAELQAEEVGSPAAEEIQVVAEYSLVSPGSEMNFYRGESNFESNLPVATAEGTSAFPIKFGYQTVGIVAEVGAGADFEPGDRVFCRHPHQGRFNILPVPQVVVRVPAHIGPRVAIFGNMFKTALNSLLDAPVRPGDNVAVTGLGMVGLFSAFLARLNAGKLVIVDPIEQRRARAGWIGADAVVHPDEAATAIDELTEGRGVDLFIEASGAPAALQLALQTTGDGGTIDVASWYGTRRAELLLSPEFHLRRYRVLSSMVAGLSKGAYPGWDNERAVKASFEFLAQIDEANLVTHELPFSRAPEAYELIDTRPEETLGVLMVHDH